MGIRTNYNGQTYYVNYLTSQAGSVQVSTEIYLSRYDNQCSVGDLAIDLKARRGTSAEMTNTQAACQAAGYVNATQTITGCFAMTSAVVCGLVTVETGGAAVIFCDLVWKYAATGAADCIKGIFGALSDELKGTTAWKSLGVAMSIEERNIGDFIFAAMDVYCDKNINPYLEPFDELN